VSSPLVSIVIPTHNGADTLPDVLNAIDATSERELQTIWSEIEKVNRKFARVEQIKKFCLLETQLTAEDDELTPTMKLKRKFVNEKYIGMIDGMYAEAG
jgi:long-chain acyl-CoA synthetase